MGIRLGLTLTRTKEVLVVQDAIEHARAAGASAQVIEEKAQQMRQLKELYDRPLVNAAITFLEPFPIGLVVTVISAAILRTRREACLTRESARRRGV